MQKRIEFIDLAKGICMLMLIAGPGHCGLPIYLPGSPNLLMPLFFIVSGIFSPQKIILEILCKKKINKLLVPFLFFYLTAYVVFYFVNWMTPELIKTDATGILDVFTQRQYFNGPIWFLICLFWSNIYFYLIQQFFKNDIWKLVAVALTCGTGVMLGKRTIFLPCMMDVAMTALPFFYIGYLLKRTKILIPNQYERYNLIFATVLWGISFCIERYCEVGCISFHYNRYSGLFIIDVINALCGVFVVLFLCKTFKYIPVISYCGRYSIILLCTHHMYYRPLIVLFNRLIPTYSLTLTVVFTIVLCILSVPLCKRFIPKFCAQEDLLKPYNPQHSK